MTDPITDEKIAMLEAEAAERVATGRHYVIPVKATTLLALIARLRAAEALAESAAILQTESVFRYGDRVRKISGSSWHGRVVGWYRTEQTPFGVAVESEREPGSVQIYPEAALQLVARAEVEE